MLSDIFAAGALRRHFLAAQARFEAERLERWRADGEERCRERRARRFSVTILCREAASAAGCLLRPRQRR